MKELEKLFVQIEAVGLAMDDYFLTQEESVAGEKLATKYALMNESRTQDIAGVGQILPEVLGLRKSEIEVNSTHHQAVKDPGRARVCAVAPDQIVEAIELPDQFALGVQWHPELLAGNEHLALYKALVERARR